MHEYKYEICDPAHQAKIEEIARISAKSEFRRTIKKEEKNKIIGEARTKFRAEML